MPLLLKEHTMPENKPFMKFSTIVENTKKSVNEISLDELQSIIDSDHKLNLIDVREESEWDKGHIPGAIHLSKGTIERDIEKNFPHNEEKLILYCGGGSRSALAASNLQKMGYTNVLSLIGGYRGWMNKN
jgi:rhodanese-related sulfurtransferase